MASESSQAHAPTGCEGKHKRVTFRLTGFSTFAGVPHNPTEELLKALSIQDLSENYGVHVSDKSVVEVSGRACQQYFARWTSPTSNRPEHDENLQDHIVFVHLGVEQEQRPKLECCAYNAANFRVPDQQHWQPCKECIDISRPYDDALYSNLQVPELVEGLCNKGLAVDVSKDPGRFVCNYMFYKSLQFCHLHGSRMPAVEERTAGRPRMHSLFVHLPHFHFVRKSEQLQFITLLIVDIQAQLTQEGCVQIGA